MRKHDPLTILLVEDDADTRKILAEVIALAFPDLQVYDADSGATGLECFKKYAPSIVITDMNMPVMDGIGMVKQIKAIDAEVKLIILTAFSDKSILAETTTEIKIDHYVQKPTDYGKLFAAIEQCIADMTPNGVLAERPYNDKENADDETPFLTDTASQISSQASAPSHPAPGITPSYASHTANLRVLVVEDDMLARETTGSLLESYGYEVQLADSGQNALTQIETFRPQAVLMDIGLPDLNGYQLAENIRNRPDGMKMLLVAISGRGRPEDIAQSKQAGFDHHLVKPFIFAPLRELLSTWKQNLQSS